MERGGIITNQGVQELKNASLDPEGGFSYSDEDLNKLNEETTLATFHTHPNCNSVLTTVDYISFLSYPRLKHYIVGKDGVRCYRIQKGVIIEEN